MGDTVLDEGSNRLVAPFIGFPKKERVFGNNARKLGLKNSTGTISNPFRYLGKSFVEASSISTFSLVPVVANPNLSKGGILTPAFKINYRGEVIFITPEHATALILKHALQHTRKTNILSKECVISIPNNASYSYGEALQTAVQVAQLDALKLSTSTENLATVQGLLERYSMKKSCVLYLDLGHSGMNVGCVKFGEGGWEVISSDTFIEFSGELMDQKLVNYFINLFKKKHREDMTINPHSIAKILNVLPKLKKNLTINKEASYTIDFLYKNIDFSLKLTREELYKQNQSSIENFLCWLKEFLVLTKIRLGNVNITHVEAVGGVSRMYDLRLRLCKLLEEEIKINSIGSRLNADEAVAKGAVLQCAILSPRYHFAKLNIKETIPWSICVAKEDLIFQVNNWEKCKYEVLFPQHNELNKTKTITFKKPRSLSLLLIQENPNKTRQLIGVAQTDCVNLQLDQGHSWKSFQIIIVLTRNGLLELKAQATKYHTETVDVKKNEEVSVNDRDLSKNIQQIKKQVKTKMWHNWKYNKTLLKLKSKEKGILTSQTIIETKIPKIKKNKTIERLQKQERKRYSKLPVSITFTTLTSLSLQTKQQIMDMEKKMSQFDYDCLQQLTSRNDLETYILNAQSEFPNGGIYFEFMNSEESDAFLKEIFKIDDWLNDDWEMNKALSEYREKLTKIRKVGDEYVLRYTEWQNRPILLEDYNTLIKQIQTWLKNERHSSEYKHITDEQVKELATHMNLESEWLALKMKEHTGLSKCTVPHFSTETISKRLEKTKSAFEKIKTISKPLEKKKNVEYEKSEEKGPEDIETTNNKTEQNENT